MSKLQPLNERELRKNVRLGKQWSHATAPQLGQEIKETRFLPADFNVEELSARAHLEEAVNQ